MSVGSYKRDTRHAVFWLILILANIFIAAALFSTLFVTDSLLPSGVYRNNWFYLLNGIQYWSLMFYFWVFPVVLILCIVLGFIRKTEKVARRMLTVIPVVGIVGLLEWGAFILAANFFL